METFENTSIENLNISPEDILLISGHDLQAATKEHQYIRKFLGHRSKDLLLTQYCDFWNLNQDEIISYLYPRQEGYNN